MIEREIRHGRHSRDFPGLPIDSVREDECETRTGLHLVVDFMGTDTAVPSEKDSPCLRMELFNFQQASANPALSCGSDMDCRMNSVFGPQPSSGLAAWRRFDGWKRLSL